MRILINLQPLQTPGASARGVGRYTNGLLRVLALSHEVIGVRAVLPLHRIYDRKLLRDLLRPLKIKKIDFGIKIGDKTWISPVTEKQAAVQKHNATTQLPSAVAMVVCTRPRAYR